MDLARLHRLCNQDSVYQAEQSSTNQSLFDSAMTLLHRLQVVFVVGAIRAVVRLDVKGNCYA
jgi:hypothetical protein